MPKGSLAAYQSADGWKNFWNLSEIDDEKSGIDAVISDETKAEIGRYSLQGHQVGKDYKGVVIVKYSDGSSKKLLNN